LRQATLKIAFDASRRLAPVLGGLGKRLHDNLRNCSGQIATPLRRRLRSPRDVAVHPRHWVRGPEGRIDEFALKRGIIELL
jgi:hypothetical protein